MGKLSNIITFLELLNSGRKYDIKELSEKLEVTPRMIRFYKEELEKAGIYIDTIYGRNGGYVLRNRVLLPSRRLTKADASYLQSIAARIHEERFDQLLDRFRPFVLEERVLVQESEKPIYNLISKAIREKRKLNIVYASHQKGQTERTIHPYELFFLEKGWGVAAFCEKKQDIRHFELDRIKDISLLPESFE